MTTVALLAVLGVLAGIAVLVARQWNKRPGSDDGGGAEILPYLILALAVGVVGFSLARLARAALTTSFAGDLTGEIATALAGLVVAAPIAFLLWRRQRRRRSTHLRAPGWALYLSVIELVFLTAFFTSVSQVALGMVGSAIPVQWSDLLVYGGLVAFHWWAATDDPPQGDAAELPRLIGAGVALIALAVGLQGVIEWLLTEGYEAAFGSIVDRFLDARTGGERLAGPLALLVTAAPIWAWRWLPSWPDQPSPLRHLYLGFASVAGLTTFLGSAIALATTVIGYWVASTSVAAVHFSEVPLELSVLIVGWALWAHHRRRMSGRDPGVRGYEYAMAAIGLGTLVGAGTALVASLWDTPIAGDPSRQGIIGLGLAVLVGGGIWRYFWAHARDNRIQELRAPQRRAYLVGMALVMGLTAVGALIAVLVITFQAILGEGDRDLDGLATPVTLAVLSGIATWHLLTVLRADGPTDTHVPGAPFDVTVICSHPGPLATTFPGEARVKVLYREDEAGAVDQKMADEIVAAVGGRPSLVWVDGDGFRVAPSRHG